jgi:hypothetical protein
MLPERLPDAEYMPLVTDEESDATRCVVQSLLRFKRSEGAARSLQDRRQCFSLDEIDDLVSALPGLPLCIRYDEKRIVGTVLEAYRTLTDYVWVKACIDATTEEGAQAASEAEQGVYKGMGLGHWFEQDHLTGATQKTARCVGLERRY